jgi:hypothetical protein
MEVDQRLTDVAPISVEDDGEMTGNVDPLVTTEGTGRDGAKTSRTVGRRRNHANGDGCFRVDPTIVSRKDGPDRHDGGASVTSKGQQ